jgi:hypothetical protein
MSENTASVSVNPLAIVKAQVAEFMRRMIQPHTLSFNLTVAAVAGIITAAFVTITLLIVMVAANFNVLGLIE